MADRLGAIEDAAEIGINDLSPVLDRAVQDTLVGSFPSIGDEAIDLAKVGDDVLDELETVVVGRDIELVCLGLDAVLLLELLDIFLSSISARRVCDCDIAAHFGYSARGLNAHAAGSRGACHGDHFALHGQKVHKGLSLGNLDHSGGSVEEGELKGIKLRGVLLLVE